MTRMRVEIPEVVSQPKRGRVKGSKNKGNSELAKAREIMTFELNSLDEFIDPETGDLPIVSHDPNSPDPSRPFLYANKACIRYVEYLSGRGLNKENIGNAIGCTGKTFTAICRRQPEVERAYLKGKTRGVVAVANALHDAAVSGNTVAQIFFLKSAAGWKDTQTVEHTGADGAPLAVFQLPTPKKSMEEWVEAENVRDIED